MDQTKTVTRGGRIAGAAAPTTLLVALDRRTRVPLRQQVYASIRDAILAGRLAPDARLPPSRDLADDLGVSRTTVVLAYEQLDTEGYVVGRGSAGSFVTSLRIAPPAAVAGAGAASLSEAKRRRAIDLSRQGTGLPHVRAAPLPFRIGEPALDLFPIRLWARLSARRARRAGAALLGYGDPEGHRPLRAAIAAYASAARGVNATADQVILTRGTQQAIHLAARVLAGPDTTAWVEDPGYLAPRALLQATGAAIVPVPVDDEGIIVSEGIRLAPRARLAYVAPSHQFPLGAMMSLPRRLALLEWASRAGAWIFEDDYDSEFRYAGAPMPSLQGLDRTGRVIYVGTFSKTMFPALRLGYLIVPASLVDVFRASQSMVDHVAPTIEHATLAEFIEDGHFARHVREMRGAYAARQEALLRGIARELGGLVEAAPMETGMHLIGWLANRSVDDALVSRLAWDARVEAAPLSAYTKKALLPPALLMGFAAVRPIEMGPALRVLRQAIIAATRRAGGSR